MARLFAGASNAGASNAGASNSAMDSGSITMITRASRLQALCKAEDKLIAQMPRENAERRALLGRATCWDHVFGAFCADQSGLCFEPESEPEKLRLLEQHCAELEPMSCASCGQEMGPLSLSHLTLSEADMAQHRARVHEQKEAMKKHMLNAHGKTWEEVRGLPPDFESKVEVLVEKNASREKPLLKIKINAGASNAGASNSAINGRLVHFRISKETPLSKMLKAFCKEVKLGAEQLRFSAPCRRASASHVDDQAVHELQVDDPRNMIDLELEDGDTIDAVICGAPEPKRRRTADAPAAPLDRDEAAAASYVDTCLAGTVLHLAMLGEEGEEAAGAKGAPNSSSAGSMGGALTVAAAEAAAAEKARIREFNALTREFRYIQKKEQEQQSQPKGK